MPELASKITNIYSNAVSLVIEQGEETMELVEKTAKNFVLNYTQLVIQMYCENQESLVKKAKNKKKEEGEPSV